MAASSPSTSNNSTTVAPSFAAALPATNTSKNLRGLNKPKCIKCGNVARSRCPYQSCKSCCAKAQNPCHIHVLKTNATFPDKAPSSSSPLFDQQSAEVSSSGNSHRFSSLRQLSNNFAQFNNLQSPLRSRKPLTRKDAAVINEWRFLKLKEYKEGKIEAENEAFDRYMENISLLEEVLAVNSTSEGPTMEDSAEMVAAGLKLKLRSNPARTENLRRSLQGIVDQGLRKLRKIDSNNGGNDPSKQDELVKEQDKGTCWPPEKTSTLSDLLDELSKARNEEDLKSCLEMKSMIFNRQRTSQMETEGNETTKQEPAGNDISLRLKSDYSPQKWLNTANVDQDALNRIDVHFSSLEDVEAL